VLAFPGWFAGLTANPSASGGTADALASCDPVAPGESHLASLKLTEDGPCDPAAILRCLLTGNHRSFPTIAANVRAASACTSASLWVSSLALTMVSSGSSLNT